MPGDTGYLKNLILTGDTVTSNGLSTDGTSLYFEGSAVGGEISNVVNGNLTILSEPSGNPGIILNASDSAVLVDLKTDDVHWRVSVYNNKLDLLYMLSDNTSQVFATFERQPNASTCFLPQPKLYGVPTSSTGLTSGQVWSSSDGILRMIPY
jgi:hypothetical protein